MFKNKRVGKKKSQATAECRKWASTQQQNSYLHMNEGSYNVSSSAWNHEM